MAAPGPTHVSATAPAAGWGRTAVGLGATLLGAAGMAIAVPLLLVLGASPTFFSAHGAAGRDIVLFVAGVVLVPTLVGLVVLLIVRRLGVTVADVLLAALVGVAAAVVVLPYIDRAVPLRSWQFAALALPIAVVVAVAHRRNAGVRRFVRILAVGPVIVAGWLLLISPASGLVLPGQDVGKALARKDTNVVFVVFDELPLAAMLDGEGRINERRFPGFAELAGRSTWYRRATTVAPWTNLAVPALLSGRKPVFPATASYYAGNVFSMLDPTHRLVPHEVVTNLCPGRSCGRAVNVGQLYDDASILYLHTLLPNGPAARFLPSIEGRWANFRGRDDVEETVGEPTGAGQANRFERFLDAVETPPREGPTAWVGHFLLPHFPLRHLPDGRLYDDSSDLAGLDTGAEGPGIYWSDQPPAIDVARQRFVLQARYVDSLVARLLDTLDERGTDEPTMLVVAADHGVTFERGNTRGAPYRAASAPDMLPVPLFVAYPDQLAGDRQGQIDDRQAQTIDIVPTIADALDVDLPATWTFEGRSLLGDDSPRDPIYFDGGPSVTPPRTTDPTPAVRKYLDAFGTWRGRHDTFAWGPHHEALGTRVEPAGESRATARRRSADREPNIVPALIELTFDRAPETTWFAVTINRSVVALGRSYRDGDEHVGVAVAEPALTEDGLRHEIGVLIADASGEWLVAAEGL